MRSSALVFGVCGAMLLACGSEPVEYVELGEVCGESSPLRVLELGPDQMVRGYETLRVQDRVLYVVSSFDKERNDVPFAITTESTVWSAGACGESPVQVATGVDDLFTIERWPDVVLGCEAATGNVVVVDPTGAEAPHVVFAPGLQERYGCVLQWTDRGMLSVEKHDEEFGALMLHPYPNDPRTETAVPELVIDPIRIGPSGGNGPGYIGNVLYTYPDEILALTPEETLVRVDLADGAVSTLQTSVAGFEASQDGQYVLWQDTTVTRDDPNAPEGKLFLRDRADGSDTLLGEGALRSMVLPLKLIEHGIIQIGLGFTKAPSRVFFLPGFDFIDLEAGLSLTFQLPDGRWMATSFFGGHLDAIDPTTQERTRMFPREARVLRRDDEALQVLETRSDTRADAPLWRVPLDGSPRTKLADRVMREMRPLDDGRLLSPVGVGAHWVGALVLVEPETRAELRVDDRVHSYSLDVSRANDEGIVSYSVSDGERSGVYLAKLPAAGP